MDPITETINISIEFGQTAEISLTTTTVASNTYETTGTIYLPAFYSAYNHLVVIASFTLFLFIGSAMKKPTSFILAWIGLTMAGAFSHGNVYWSFLVLAMLAAFTLYLMIRNQED